MAADVALRPPLPGTDARTHDGPRCGLIFYNLARAMRRGAGKFPAADFVGELFQTARCDDVHDMEPVRRAFVDFLGPARAFNIIKGVDLSVDDETQARRALLHYHVWTYDSLCASFTWRQKARWYFWDNVHRTGAYSKPSFLSPRPFRATEMTGGRGDRREVL